MFGYGNEEILKGNPPRYDKKETLSEKLKYFCSKHHWDKGIQYGQMLDENSDGYVKPTLKLFLYNCYRELRGWGPIFGLRMNCQKIFRKNHMSDNQLWDLQYPLSKYVYKYLKAFKDQERNGYPGVFSEYNENEWQSKEEYDQAILDGKMFGGGGDAWEKVLNHILMSLEYIVLEGNSKKESEWFIKYFGMDPYKENEEVNKYIKFEYRDIDAKKYIGCAMSGTQPNLDKVEWCTKSTSYLNHELIHYAEEVVSAGLCELGYWWRNFWD